MAVSLMLEIWYELYIVREEGFTSYISHVQSWTSGLNLPLKTAWRPWSVDNQVQTLLASKPLYKNCEVTTMHKCM